MKILTIVGARPQFIKASMLSRALAGNGSICEVIVHTGQHYDPNMSDVFFAELGIPQPHHNLKISQLDNISMTKSMVERLIPLFRSESPDAVLVYGDTNSTLAGALAACELDIPVAHIEAGLRSFNSAMAEERNRIETDRIASWLFCPTASAMKHLNAEAVPGKAFLVGDIMFDATQFFAELAHPGDVIKSVLDTKFYLATIHRAENVDEPSRLKAIFDSFSQIAKDVRVVLPLHPRTKKALIQQGVQIPPSIKIMDPLGYLDMLCLLRHSFGVFTDSGGLQKEAFFMHKPCVTLRDETEWTETLAAGVNRLAGADRQKILAGHEWMSTCTHLKFPSDIFGDGKTAQKIIEILQRELNF